LGAGGAIPRPQFLGVHWLADMAIRNDDSTPLCVDLDGTLVLSDTLLECTLGCLKAEPWSIFRLLGWARQSRALFKNRVAQKCPVEPEHLPYNPKVLEFMLAEKENGRRLVLATGSDKSTAQKVSGHLDCFDEVVASDGRRNLSGANKRLALEERFGATGFDYVGNSRADLAVWRGCQRAYLVRPEPGVEKQVRSRGLDYEVLDPNPREQWRSLLKAMRPWQWAKNLLVVAPLVLAHKVEEPWAWLGVVLAMLAFCFCASAVYLANDLWDLASDRRHPSKQRRPLASGDLPLTIAMGFIPLLGFLGLALAALAAWEVLWLLLIYLLLTSAYSIKLKEVPLLDILVLAGLYSVRILAGGPAAGVVISFWLVIFSTFFFLSLAFLKRYTELKTIGGMDPAGRGYRQGDQGFLSAAGIASGYLAVLVVALYLNSPKVRSLYNHGTWLWLICPLVVYWISRVWLKAHRGEMEDDPVLFALKDPTSYVVVGLALIILVLAA
jgi:4-hydroxybenzoate polyprenyltransferase/phosphoserine phosphatase